MFPFRKATLVVLASLFTSATVAQSPGYGDIPSTLAANASLSFGQHYAVLNLDLINGLVGSINTTTQGQSFINNTARWINAVHQQNPAPLSIFTRIYFSTVLRPEIGPTSPFASAVAALGNATDTSPQSQIYPAFQPLPDYDVVLRKSRYYSGDGNSLEEILSSQQIDTVVLVCSFTILSDLYQLY